MEYFAHILLHCFRIMHKSYHSFLTGVMDPLIGICVYQLLTIEDIYFAHSVYLFVVYGSQDQQRLFR
jgi:hypothetical protein